MRPASTQLRVDAGPTWRQFLFNQAHGIIAVDFFHIDTALGNRLCALVFLEHATRRLHLAGVTAHPTRDWVTQQARNLATDLDAPAGLDAVSVTRPRWQVLPAFDAVFHAEQIHILQGRVPGPV
jgi:hypothetical protein